MPTAWYDPTLVAKWDKVRAVRAVVTGALEISRARKEIGSSLEAAPEVFIADADLRDALRGVDFADVCITSDIVLYDGEAPADAFRLVEVPGVAVLIRKAAGVKCARSWKISLDVGSDPEFPDVTLRDAGALRELRHLGALARSGAP